MPNSYRNYDKVQEVLPKIIDLEVILFPAVYLISYVVFRQKKGTNRSVTKNATCDNLSYFVTEKSVSCNVIKVMKKKGRIAGNLTNILALSRLSLS